MGAPVDTGFREYFYDLFKLMKKTVAHMKKVLYY
jgi:hypothetical protein